MRNKSLIFIPNTLALSFVCVLDEIQTEIDKGSRVVLIGCEASISHCDLNPKGSKYVCFACTHCLKHSIKLLRGEYEYYSYKHFLPKNNIANKCYDFKSVHNLRVFRQIKHKSYEIGYAVASTYISATRNHNPVFNNRLKRFLSSLMFDSMYIYNSSKLIVDQIQPDKITIFNGRKHISRPVLSIAHSYQIPIDVLEVIGAYGYKTTEKVRFKGHLPHSIKHKTDLINKYWDEAAESKAQIAQTFYEKKKTGYAVGDRSYVKNQETGLLPENFNVEKNNIAIFVSSEDEMAAIGKEWEWTYFGGSQINAINAVLKLFETENDFYFYVRVHPNLKAVKYKYHTDYYHIQKQHQNVTVIPADSPISTYSLIDNCDKIITFGSSVGVEATFWNKPSILIGKTSYMYLDVTYNPKDELELKALLKNIELKPKSQLGSLKYGLFIERKAEQLKYFDSNKHKKKPGWLNKNLFLYNLLPNKKVSIPVIANFLLFSTARLLNNLFLYRRIPKEEL